MLSIFRSLATAGALFISFSALAQEQEAFEIGPVPLRSILYLSERGNPPVSAPKTKYWLDPQVWDEEEFTYRSPERHYNNASSWGIEGLIAEETSIYQSRKTAPGQFCSVKRDFTERQLRLARHVIRHARALPNGALTWFYDYDQNSNDQLLFAPLNSAFSQAMNLHFMLLAHCRTNEAEYLEVAKRAGDALITPVSQGGLLNDADGETWFEEGPGAPGLMQYILNAHIYSVNVLFLLAERSGDERFRHAAQRGVETLERLLYKFDTGYWTRYDLRPRYHTLYLEVHHDPETTIQQIEVRDRNGTGSQSRWSLCEQSCDLVTGAARNGYSLRFAATIETLRRYLPKAGDELEIEVKYAGAAEPQIYAAGVRPDIKEMVRLPSSTSSKGVVRSLMGVREFGWHSPGANYIEYHAMLLADLYRWRSNPLFFASAIRFANYHRAWRNEKGKPVPEVTTRRFSPDTNEMANAPEDAQIAACFRDLEPAAVDLAVATSRLPTCEVERQSYVSILRRMGFRVSEDRTIASDGAATFSIFNLTKVE